jgi:hypothetical protein
VSEEVARLLERISLHPRFGRFSEGMVYLDDLAYFLGVAVVSGAIARLSIDLRRVGG